MGEANEGGSPVIYEEDCGFLGDGYSVVTHPKVCEPITKSYVVL